MVRVLSAIVTIIFGWYLAAFTSLAMDYLTYASVLTMHNKLDEDMEELDIVHTKFGVVFKT